MRLIATLGYLTCHDISEHLNEGFSLVQLHFSPIGADRLRRRKEGKAVKEKVVLQLWKYSMHDES